MNAFSFSSALNQRVTCAYSSRFVGASNCSERDNHEFEFCQRMAFISTHVFVDVDEHAGDDDVCARDCAADHEHARIGAAGGAAAVRA